MQVLLLHQYQSGCQGDSRAFDGDLRQGGHGRVLEGSEAGRSEGPIRGGLPQFCAILGREAEPNCLSEGDRPGERLFLSAVAVDERGRAAVVAPEQQQLQGLQRDHHSLRHRLRVRHRSQVQRSVPNPQQAAQVPPRYDRPPATGTLHD